MTFLILCFAGLVGHTLYADYQLEQMHQRQQERELHERQRAAIERVRAEIEAEEAKMTEDQVRMRYFYVRGLPTTVRLSE